MDANSATPLSVDRSVARATRVFDIVRRFLPSMTGFEGRETGGG